MARRALGGSRVGIAPPMSLAVILAALVGIFGFV